MRTPMSAFRQKLTELRGQGYRTLVHRKLLLGHDAQVWSWSGDTDDSVDRAVRGTRSTSSGTRNSISRLGIRALGKGEVRVLGLELDVHLATLFLLLEADVGGYPAPILRRIIKNDISQNLNNRSSEHMLNSSHTEANLSRIIFLT